MPYEGHFRVDRMTDSLRADLVRIRAAKKRTDDDLAKLRVIRSVAVGRERDEAGEIIDEEGRKAERRKAKAAAKQAAGKQAAGKKDDDDDFKSIVSGW